MHWNCIAYDKHSCACKEIKLLMMSIIVQWEITYDKHYCAMHWLMLSVVRNALNELKCL